MVVRIVIRIALVEDDKVYMQQIREYLGRYEEETGREFSVQMFSDGEDITEDYRAEYDIIFMDIQMQFMDGMTAAAKIREKDHGVVIIFLTSMVSYAVKGYEVEAFDYIVKPVSYPVFSQKLGRALERVKDREIHYIMVPVSGGSRRIDVSRLYYIESRSHKMFFHTKDGVMESKGRMEDLEKELADFDFFRSNKGYLVNMNYVDGVDDNCCIIAGEQLPVSRRRKAEFMERITQVL